MPVCTTCHSGQQGLQIFCEGELIVCEDTKALPFHIVSTALQYTNTKRQCKDGGVECLCGPSNVSNKLPNQNSVRWTKEGDQISLLWYQGQWRCYTKRDYGMCLQVFNLKIKSFHIN